MLNNYENYGTINKDYTIKTQKDDAFESTIKEEKKRQKEIFAGNDIDYSKNMRYQQEKIKPSQDTMKVQSTLNDYGYTDQQGKKLKVDGAYGPKTDYAFNNAYDANKPIFENREKQRKRDEIMPLVDSAYDNMFADASKRKFTDNKDEIVKTKQFLNQFGYTDMQDKPLVENDVWDDNAKMAFEKYVWDGIARQEVYDLQKALNKNGITDKDGNSLLEDGKLGRKTDGAVHNALNTLGGNLDTEIKRGDTQKPTKEENAKKAVDVKIEPLSDTYAVNSGVENIANFTNYSKSILDAPSNLLGKEYEFPGKYDFGGLPELIDNNKKYANDTEHLNDYFWNNKYGTDDIKGVQKILSAQNDINLEIDGDIGINTSTAIAKYAKENGLTLEQAGDRLVELGRAFNEVEALGLSGEEIKTIQTKLNQLGITDIDGDVLDEDSILGGSTVSAIDKISNNYKISKKDAIDILLDRKISFSEDVNAISNAYDKMCIDVENAYKLNIITKEEKDILLQDTLQKLFKLKADSLNNKENNNKFVDACEKILEFGVFDFLLSDISIGTVYSPSEADYIKQKLYGNEENYEKLLCAGLTLQAN